MLKIAAYKLAVLSRMAGGLDTVTLDENHYSSASMIFLFVFHKSRMKVVQVEPKSLI